MLLIRRFLHEREGATAIEYCLIAGLISVVIVAAVGGIGTHLNTYFGSVNSGLN